MNTCHRYLPKCAQLAAQLFCQMSLSIAECIVTWFEANGRKLAFRETRDPYKIWVAEIVFQQTRLAQGMGHYERFVARFPDVQSLAAAAEDEVLKYWEGLGYYSRARNLHAAAKQVVSEMGGVLPSHYSALLALKGVGDYTARAIGAFAFGNEVGVIDGNVLRVMSRVLADFSPINEPKTRAKFQQITDSWVRGADARAFNNGIMDIGSTICTPTKPACLLCPLENHCEARKQGAVVLLPVKINTLQRKVRFFHFFIEENAAGECIIRRRPTDVFWGGLWEIPNEEVSEADWKTAEAAPLLGTLKHVFTHFDMHIAVFRRAATATDAVFVTPTQVGDYAFSKAVLKVFAKYFAQ